VGKGLGGIDIHHMFSGFSGYGEHCPGSAMAFRKPRPWA
jgi:hypothetical protein